MSDQSADYVVGYGKPPQSAQFRKGVSGNPKGRPKGSKNLATIVLKEARKRVRVNGSRGTRMVTKLEATVTQLGNKSAQGDLRAAREFFALIQRSEEAVDMGSSVLPINELDQTVIESLRRRMSSLGTVNSKSTSENNE